MADGDLDVAKAIAFAEHTRDMPDDLAGMTVARVLPHAAGSTVLQIEERIEIVAAQLDPDWYRRREHAAHARTRVEFVRNPTGTGEVALRDLSAAATAGIKGRVDALAGPLRRAARRAGLRLGLPALRALAAQRLLDGTYTGLDDDALLERLTDELPTWHAELNDDDGPDDAGRDDDGPNDAGPDDAGPDSGPTGADAGPVAVRTGTVELRMRLSTALGLDDLPGQLPGSGTLTASSARRMLSGIREGDTPAEWRLVLVDDAGHLDHVLLARPDPPRRPRRRPGRWLRGQAIVELAAPTAMLAALDPAAHPVWSEFLTHARTQLAGLPMQGAQVGGPHHPATSTTDAGNRFPGAALERFVRVRDRYCVGPFCTATAYEADIDHTRDWHHLGATIAANLGALCRHCHRLKHAGGWQLTQPAPGTFAWRSPLGATCTVQARPVLEPALRPAPRVDGRPRRVLDRRRAPRPEHDGWVDRPRRLTAADVVPTPPAGVTSHYPEEPPF